jgi:hypothetical protein
VLREGAMLRVDGEEVTVRDTLRRLFRRGRKAVEIGTGEERSDFASGRKYSVELSFSLILFASEIFLALTKTFVILLRIRMQ